MSQPPENPPLDASAIAQVLDRHRVEYVVVGGYAAEMHGASRPTIDVDVVPETSTENLQRLAAALRDLDARIRTDTVPEGLPFSTSPEALRGTRMLNLITPYGEVDLTFTPSGTQGYPDLVRAATYMPLGTVQVRVAALADIIRSKTAANRSKDLQALPELRRLAAAQGGDPAPGTVDDETRSTSEPTAHVAGQSFPVPLSGLTRAEAAAARIAAAKAQAAANRRTRDNPQGSTGC